MIRQSVLGGLSKSTSNRSKGAPKGVHCTEMTLKLGGTKTPSFGYRSLMLGVPAAQLGAPLSGKLQPMQSGACAMPMAVDVPPPDEPPWAGAGAPSGSSRPPPLPPPGLADPRLPPFADPSSPDPPPPPSSPKLSGWLVPHPQEAAGAAAAARASPPVTSEARAFAPALQTTSATIKGHLHCTFHYVRRRVLLSDSGREHRGHVDERCRAWRTVREGVIPGAGRFEGRDSRRPRAVDRCVY